MNRWIECVTEFHHRFGVPSNTVPATPASERILLRQSLIDEEATETCLALADLTDETHAMAEVADGLVDTIYVCIGAALELGIDLDPLFEEVHRTNMAKVGGQSRSDGKIMKPPGWQAPRIAELLKAQGWKP